MKIKFLNISIIFLVFFFQTEYLKSSEIKISPKNFILTSEKFEEKCIIIEMKFRDFASIQDREGFAKCTMEGVIDSLENEDEKILFYNVYLDADAVKEFKDKLFFGVRIIIHAYVDKADGHWSMLDVYKIRIPEK